MRWTLLVLLLMLLAACDSSAPAPGLEPEQGRQGGVSAVGALSAPQRHEPQVERTAVLEETLAPTVERVPRGGILRGRVVDVRGGPLTREGFQVELQHSEVLVRTGPNVQFAVTDAQGRFELSLRDRTEHTWFRLTLPDEWHRLTRFPRHLRDMDPELLTGEQELIIKVARRRRGRVRGIAVDAQSGEPLAFLRFQIRSGSGSYSRQHFEPVQIETDAAGLFESETELVGGRVHIGTAHAEARPDTYSPTLLIDNEEELWTLRFHVGEVFELDLQGEVPDDVTSLFAWAWTNSDPFRGTLRVPVHAGVAGGKPWVRFRDQCSGESRPRFLAVGDEEGLLLGVFDHESGSLASPSRGHKITLTLEQTAAVVFDFSFEGDKPNPIAASITSDPVRDLILEGALFESLHRFPSVRIEVSDTTVEDPSFPWRAQRMKGLLPGSYSVSAESRDYVAVEERIYLDPGRLHKRSLTLSFKPDRRTLHGTLRREGGKPLPRINLKIWAITKSEESWEAHYRPSSPTMHESISSLDQRIIAPKGASQVSFDIKRIAAGELAIKVECSSNPCETRFTERADGGIDLEVTVLDADR